jgi:hypothetical protein
LSTDVSEVRAASIIRDVVYIPEENSELHTRRRENLKSHTDISRLGANGKNMKKK